MGGIKRKSERVRGGVREGGVREGGAERERERLDRVQSRERQGREMTGVGKDERGIEKEKNVKRRETEI